MEIRIFVWDDARRRWDWARYQDPVTGRTRWPEREARILSLALVAQGKERGIDAAAVIDRRRCLLVAWEPADGARGDPFGPGWDPAWAPEPEPGD